MASAYPERGRAGQEVNESALDPLASAALLQGFMAFPIAMTIDREDGRVVQANDAFLSLLGMENQDVTGQRPMELGLRDLKPQARTKASTRSTRLLMSDGRVLRCDSRKIEGMAQDLFVSTYAVEGGQPRSEEADGRQEALEAISEGVVFIDQEGRLEHANGAAEALLHFDLEESRGHPISGIFAALAIPEAAQLIDAVLLRGKSEQREYYYDEDGEDRWIFVDVQRCKSGTMMVITDHSRLRLDETMIRQGEQQYKRLVELSNDGIWSVDEEFTTTFVSPRMAEILGCEKSSLSGINFYELMDLRNVEKVRKDLSPLKSGITTQIRAVLNTIEGDVEVGIRACPILNEDLDFCGALMLVTDMTALEGARSEVASMRADLAALYAVGPAGLVELDAEGHVVSLCQRVEEMSGSSESSLTGKDIMTLFMPEDQERLRQAWDHSARGRAPLAEEVRLTGPKGMMWVLVSGQLKEGGGALWSITPLQKMKDLEGQLRRTEALYNTVISNLPNGAIIFFDRELKYQFAGGPLLKEIGLSSEDIAGLHMSEAMDPGAVALMTPYYRGALEGKEASVKTDGEGGRFIMTHFLPVRIEGEGIVGGMVVGIDITENEQSIVGLRQAELRLDEMFSRASEGMAITDRRGIVLKWNESMKELTGLRAEEVIGRPIWDVEFGLLLPSQKTQAGYRQLLEHHRSMLTRGRSAVSRREMTIAGEGETQRCIEKDEFPLHGKDAEGLGIICRDVTERKFAELMLGMPNRGTRKIPGRP